MATNNSVDGRHIETLAYLFGYESEGNLVGTHLVFPEQNGTCSRVDDNGKKTFFMAKISFQPLGCKFETKKVKTCFFSLANMYFL